MDVGLGRTSLERTESTLGLNPCFSGCWSRTVQYDNTLSSPECLNPCFSGCWSRTGNDGEELTFTVKVLILVLVDVGLGHRK